MAAKIHVIITYDIAEPAPVPGSIARTVVIPEGAAHMVYGFAQDVAGEVALAYLSHVADQEEPTNGR